MAEENKEKFYINLHIYDVDFPINVERKDEVYYRAAAKLITDRYNMYANRYKQDPRYQGMQGNHKIALMVLLDIALMYQREHAINFADDNTLARLTSEIEEALK